MVNFRACGRCGGDMHMNRDMYGEYIECLQCGHMQDIQKELKKQRDWAAEKPKRGRKPKAA